MEDLKPKAHFDEFNKAHEEISESPRNFIPPVALDTKMVSGKEVINKNYTNKAQAAKKNKRMKESYNERAKTIISEAIDKISFANSPALIEEQLDKIIKAAKEIK